MRMKRFTCLLDMFRAVAAWRDARGAVLPLTLMIVVLLTTMVLALLSVGAMEPQIANNLLRSAQALNLAEAGAERVIAQFVANSALVGNAAVGGPTVTPFNAQALQNPQGQNVGTYTVTYRPIAASTVLVESTGTTNLGNVTQRVRVMVTTPPGSPPFAILGDDVQISGSAQVTGNLPANGSIHGNTKTSVLGTGDKVSGAATSASATCTSCTDPKYVGDVADSGPNKPSQALPTDNPLDYKKFADFILQDDGFIKVVATGQLVAQDTGQFKGWTHKSSQPGDWHFSGGALPPNGTYYASLEISIDKMTGTSAASPWKATLITGGRVNADLSVQAGELELQATTSPYIVPYYQDLLGVGGAAKLLGNGTYTGRVISTTKYSPKVDCKSANCGLLMQDSVTLNGNIISDGLVQVAGTSKINYTPAGGAGAFGAPQILSWTRLAQ